MLINRYEACMRAAEHIEAHPDRYHFLANEVPRAQADVGCLLGWVNYFSGTGMQLTAGWRWVDPSVLGHCNLAEFLTEIDAAAPGGWLRPTRWTRDAHEAARALRRYAERFAHERDGGMLPPDVEVLDAPSPRGFRAFMRKLRRMGDRRVIAA